MAESELERCDREGEEFERWLDTQIMPDGRPVGNWTGAQLAEAVEKARHGRKPSPEVAKMIEFMRALPEKVREILKAAEASATAPARKAKKSGRHKRKKHA